MLSSTRSSGGEKLLRMNSSGSQNGIVLSEKIRRMNSSSVDYTTMEDSSNLMSSRSSGRNMKGIPIASSSSVASFSSAQAKAEALSASAGSRGLMLGRSLSDTLDTVLHESYVGGGGRSTVSKEKGLSKTNSNENFRIGHKRVHRSRSLVL